MKTALFFPLILAGLLCSPLITAAQEASEEGGGDKSASQQAFDEVFGKWKDVLGELRLLQAKAENAEDTELPAMQAEYDEKLASGEALIPQLRDAAIAVYKEAPNEDRQIMRWLSTIASDFVEADRFSEAKPALEALIEGKATDPVIYNDAGIVAFVEHDFEKAKEYFKQAAAASVTTTKSQVMMGALNDYLEYWPREKNLREAAEKAEEGKQLPLVKMTTTDGELLLELFEDEAPETVGNFISLVERGFYDDLTFHRVLGGFMAQGGCPDGTGTGGPGYEIYCECANEDHRKHFTGSLSMAHAGRDTGGSQFFVTFVPTPQLNGKHTVFGRVVEGLDLLSKIQRRDPDKPADLAVQPDKIIKAEVVRKRDHKYVPNKVK